MKPIPQFPDGRDLVFEDKPLFDSIFGSWQPDISAYTFTNLFAWRKPHGTRLSTLNGLYILSDYTDGKRSILEPLGTGDKASTVLECLSLSQDMPTTFKSISVKLADVLKEHSNLVVKFDRDNADYIYRAEDLINLNGRKLDAKRNFINRFKQKYDYEYVKLTPDNVEEVHDFVEQWCVDRNCDESEGLSKERCAVYQMLTHLNEFGIVGGAIAIDGHITAFSLAEALNDKTLVIHVEKGDTSVDGIYQMINNEFCIHEAGAYKYVNREQDLGISGLRKAKESYQPIKLGEIFKVSLKES